MPFQIKDFASIVAAQINHARAVTEKITDFQPGSVVRTIMEAPAVEIEELYMQYFLGLRDAIPEATFRSFHFDQLPAARAAGYVTISVEEPLSADILILQGTEFLASDGRVYRSISFLTWAESTTSVRVPVEAGEVGAAGNISEGGIVRSPAFSEEYTISNSAIANGRNVESQQEREARFADFVRSLSRGTVPACEYAVRQARILDDMGNIEEYVTRQGTLEQPGYVRLFIYTNRGVPSDEILVLGQRLIDGWHDDDTGIVTPGYRAAGIRIDVLPMVERVINATISVSMLSGQSLTESVKQHLGDIFATAVRSIGPGEVLHAGTLVELLLGVAGVRAVVPAINENIVCEVNEALLPGVLTVLSL